MCACLRPCVRAPVFIRCGARFCFGCEFHAPQCSNPCCVILKPEIKRGPSIEAGISDVTSPCCWSVSASVSHCGNSGLPPLLLQFAEQQKLLNGYDLLGISSVKMFSSVRSCVRSGAHMITRSIIFMSASLMWHHNVTTLLFDQSQLFPSRELLRKPAGIWLTCRPSAPQALFDAFVSKHGDPPTVLFHRTLMEGLQLSMADRHVEERDS